MAAVAGLSMAVASAYGVYYVRNHNQSVIAGSSAISAGLISYNVFKNPQYFSYYRVHPMVGLSALVLYAGYGTDVPVAGGLAGGYLAFLLL